MTIAHEETAGAGTATADEALGTTPEQDAPAPGDATSTVQQRSAGSTGRLRAAIIINPYSSGLTAKREKAIVSQLRERLDVDVMRTERAGHAPRIAAGLLDASAPDVIISCGGDGTANEILNGMSLGDDTAEARPIFAIVPAGGTNVLARSLGYPNHPVRAMDQLVDAILERKVRTINLGTVDERLFMFAAGIGIDAEVIRNMEGRRTGRRPSDAAYITSIVGVYASSRFALGDRMTITIDETGEQLRSALALIGNTTPLTYTGRFAMHVMPSCTLEGGLDFIAPQRMNALLAIRNTFQSIGIGRTNQRLVSDEQVQLRHDVPGFTIVCDEPQAVQVDGEYIGERTHICVGLLRNAVRLVV